jgi:hypothetical protein
MNQHKQKHRHKLKVKILKTLKLVMKRTFKGVEIKEDVVAEILSKKIIFSCIYFYLLKFKQKIVNIEMEVKILKLFIFSQVEF